jgi:3-isopropylmalate/(R)-2-methylmalate dehydratase small subunit
VRDVTDVTDVTSVTDARRRVVTGPAVPVRGDDIDTDRIIPARFAKAVGFDALGTQVFADDRAADAACGRVHPFDDERFASARILLVERNFGCGSSREHAVAALMRWRRGLAAVVGRSLSSIFADNCLANGVPAVTVDGEGIDAAMAEAVATPALPFALDIELCRLLLPSGRAVGVVLPADARHRLLAGTWDSLALLRANEQKIRRTAASLPYLWWRGSGRGADAAT